MERKLGEVFTYNGKTYKVVKSNMCRDCAFKDRICNIIKLYIGPCTSSIRSDKTNVAFKEVKKYMEIKNNQLTINIPKGMEIDLENSDLAKGIIKFRDKWLTLERIHGSAKEDCYLTNRCGIKDFHDSKLVAIANFMDIVRYFNGDWNYDVDDDRAIGYAIYYGAHLDNGGYRYNTISPQASVYYGIPVFKNRDDAKYVIANPNFRDILDAIYKN